MVSNKPTLSSLRQPTRKAKCCFASIAHLIVAPMTVVASSVTSWTDLVVYPEAKGRDLVLKELIEVFELLCAVAWIGRVCMR